MTASHPDSDPARHLAADQLDLLTTIDEFLRSGDDVFDLLAAHCSTGVRDNGRTNACTIIDLFGFTVAHLRHRRQPRSEQSECPGDINGCAFRRWSRQDATVVQPLEVPHLAAGDDLMLRPWELDDLSLLREASNDEYIPLITTVPAAYSHEAGEAFVQRQWARASTGGGYPFVIVRVQDDRPIGSIGLWLRDVNQGRASLGYWVVKSARGQGVATSALRAVTAWGLDDLRIPRLELYIEPRNTASARTAGTVGFQREGLLRSWQQVGQERRDMITYSVLSTD